MIHRWACLVLLAAVGCRRAPAPIPMEVGRSWTYTVRSGLDMFVEPASIVRRVPAAGTTGFELAGPLGTSRMAWQNDALVAESAANARFTPPLPLYFGGRRRTDWDALVDKVLKQREDAAALGGPPAAAAIPLPIVWSGWLESLGKRQPAKATLTLERVELSLGGRKRKTTLSTLNMRTPLTTMELKTWFEAGVGIVQQEQRTDGQLDVSIQLLDHG